MMNGANSAMKTLSRDCVDGNGEDIDKGDENAPCRSKAVANDYRQDTTTGVDFEP